MTQTESALTGDYNETTDQNTTKDGCVLTDSATPLANASAATVQVFGGDSADMFGIEGYVPMAQIVAPLPLPSLTTNAPGATTPVWDELTFPENIQMEEVHLYSALDNHVDLDRGGRKRWALQKNQATKHLRADNYDAFQVPGGVDKLAANWQKRAKYFSYAKGTPLHMMDVINHLSHDRLFHYAGFGAGDSPIGPVITDYCGGTEIQTPNDNTVFAHAQRLFYLNPFPQFFTTARGFYCLDQIFPFHTGQTPVFSNLLLAVWEGCLTGYSSTDPSYRFGNLVDATVTLGAKCSVGFNDTISLGSDDTVWANSFWQAMTLGETSATTGKPNGIPDTVNLAITYAVNQVKNQYLGQKQGYSIGYDSCRAAGDKSTIIAQSIAGKIYPLP